MKNTDKEIKRLLSDADAADKADVTVPDMSAKIKEIAASAPMQRAKHKRRFNFSFTKKIVASCTAAVLIICAVAAALLLGDKTPQANKADWNALYQTALGWGYEGELNEFVALLLGDGGDRDDESNAGLSAYEIYKKYHPDYQGSSSNWREDLASGKLGENPIPDETKETMKILYVSSTSNNFFRGFILTLGHMWSPWWNVQVEEAQLDNAVLSGYDFYIFENETPAVLPSDGVVLLVGIDRAPENSGLVFGAVSNGSSAMQSLAAGEPSHIMKDITPENISVSRYAVLLSYEGYTPLMYCDSTPVFLVKDEPGAKIAVFTFKMAHSNMPLTAEFPRLMYNIFYYLSPL